MIENNQTRYKKTELTLGDDITGDAQAYQYGNNVFIRGNIVFKNKAWQYVLLKNAPKPISTTPVLAMVFNTNKIIPMALTTNGEIILHEGAISSDNKQYNVWLSVCYNVI